MIATLARSRTNAIAKTLAGRRSRPGASPVRAHRAAVVSAGSEATRTRKAEVALLPEHLIGGDEAIILAIKPSLWFIAFDSANWLAGTLFAIVLSRWISDVLPGVSEAQFVSAVLGLLAVRVGVGVLRWVSRFYVLTNRRIMSLRGVFRAEVFECPLLSIRNTAVRVGFLEAFPKLGSVVFAVKESGGAHHEWVNVANPDQVHEAIRKAIRRAIDSQPHF